MKKPMVLFVFVLATYTLLPLGLTQSEAKDFPTLSESEWQSKSIDYWREHLTPEQVRVCRKEGTEKAFSSDMHKSKQDGVYRCSSCGLELFDSKAKFDSGTGWPSFWQPINDKAVTLHADYKLIIKRTEVKCARCNAHLGHVFNDGPRPTGKRYCINAVCLDFLARAEKVPQEKKSEEDLKSKPKS